jgi:hypothetical protein
MSYGYSTGCFGRIDVVKPYEIEKDSYSTPREGHEDLKTYRVEVFLCERFVEILLHIRVGGSAVDVFRTN